MPNTKITSILLFLMLLSISIVAAPAFSNSDDESEEEEPARVKKLSQVEVKHSEKFDNWKSRYKDRVHFTPDSKDATDAEYRAAADKLKANQKPFPSAGEVYVGKSGDRRAATRKLEDGRVAYVGPNHMNYVQRREGENPFFEAHATPTEKDAKVSGRKHPKYEEVYIIDKDEIKKVKRDKRKLSKTDNDIVFDAGHGIDHAITIVHKGSNSSTDPTNFTPQNGYYNRVIRVGLVKKAKDIKGSYKELAIYGENPHEITRKVGRVSTKRPIPEGFVFFILDDRGAVANSYYFDNYYHYKKELEDKQDYKIFLQKLSLPDHISKDIWCHYSIASEDERAVHQRLSEYRGYRSLSGRYEVLPEGVWSGKARNALVRTAATYEIQRAAELDNTVENMLEAASLHASDFVFLEFEGTLRSPQLTAYWCDRVLKEVMRNPLSYENFRLILNYADDLPFDEEPFRKARVLFSNKLVESPDIDTVLALMNYYEGKDEITYRSWSKTLSDLVKDLKVPKAVDLQSPDEIVQVMANTGNVSIVLSFDPTNQNMRRLFEGFKQRAKNEQKLYDSNLRFLEFGPDFTAYHVEPLLEAFEYGLDDLYVDVRRTTLKVHQDKDLLRSLLAKKYPKTLVRIID